MHSAVMLIASLTVGDVDVTALRIRMELEAAALALRKQEQPKTKQQLDLEAFQKGEWRPEWPQPTFEPLPARKKLPDPAPIAPPARQWYNPATQPNFQEKMNRRRGGAGLFRRMSYQTVGAPASRAGQC